MKDDSKENDCQHESNASTIVVCACSDMCVWPLDHIHVVCMCVCLCSICIHAYVHM